MKTYGGGLFAPLSKRDFLHLKRQFGQIIPANPLGDVSVWARARHSIRTRDDIQREKGLDH